MTNQEILQQVYESMPNEFTMKEFINALWGIDKPKFNAQATVDFLEERAIEGLYSYTKKQPNIQVGTVLVAKVECSGSLIISKEYRVNAIAGDVFYIDSESHVAHRFSFKNINNYFTTKPKEVDPLWVYVYIDYYNKLVDIERKYNQLMKSFKEVEG